LILLNNSLHYFVIKHENFDSVTYNNDIAILKLLKSVTLNRAVQVACLPTQQSNTYPSTSVPAWAVGWGNTSI
jgi:hypothetical protein